MTHTHLAGNRTVEDKLEGMFIFALGEIPKKIPLFSI
jgi:hypothetical protein